MWNVCSGSKYTVLLCWHAVYLCLQLQKCCRYKAGLTSTDKYQIKLNMRWKPKIQHIFLVMALYFFYLFSIYSSIFFSSFLCRLKHIFWWVKNSWTTQTWQSCLEGTVAIFSFKPDLRLKSRSQGLITGCSLKQGKDKQHERDLCSCPLKS